jgi:hypothetical protein
LGGAAAWGGGGSDVSAAVAAWPGLGGAVIAAAWLGRGSGDGLGGVGRWWQVAQLSPSLCFIGSTKQEFE